MLHQITLTLESVAAELIFTPGYWEFFIAMAIGICVFLCQTKSLCYSEDFWLLKKFYISG